MNVHLRRCAVAAVLALAGTVVAAAPASASSGGGSELLDDPPPEQTVTDEGDDSSGEEPPVDDEVIEELLPKGPPGPVGFVDVPTYEAIWVPGETIPSQVNSIHGDNNADIVTVAGDDGSLFAALLVIGSAEAATEYRFQNAVPEGHKAILNPDGAVQFFDADGKESGGIAAPWAIDAEGIEVPTSYRLDGNTLIQEVRHHGFAYPVIADPLWFTVIVVVAVARVVIARAAAQAASRAAARAAVGASTSTAGTCAKSSDCRGAIERGVSYAWRNRQAFKSGSGSSSGSRPSSGCNLRTRRGC